MSHRPIDLEAKCHECESIGVNHADMVNRARRSPLDAVLLFAGWTFLNTPFHQALNQHFMTNYEAGIRRFAYLCSRTHAKTTLFGIGIPLWRFANDTNDTILCRMASSDNTQKTLRVITNVLKNSPFVAHYFPHLTVSSAATAEGRRDNSQSTQRTLILPREKNCREGTYEARSVTSRVTGGHYNWVLGDDLIDETSVSSDTLQDKAIDIVKNSDSLMADQKDDVEMILGTYWPGVFYRWLTEDSGIMDDYASVVVGCYVDDRYREFLESIGLECHQEDGEPVWPEKYDIATLKRIEKKAPVWFSSQWLNIPITDDLMRFDPNDFKYYNLDATRENVLIYSGGGGNDVETLKIPVKRLRRILTVDPATGEGNRTDESALVCCGYDQKTGLVIVLDAIDGRWLPYELISRTLDMAERWNVERIAPEDVSFQKTLKHYMKREMQKRGVYFMIKGVKPGSKSKGWRIIDGLQPFIANHQVYFAKRQKRLTDELTRIQIVKGKVIGKSPNLVDALAYQSEFWGFAGQEETPTDDVDYEDSFVPPVGRSYGLECVT